MFRPSLSPTAGTQKLNIAWVQLVILLQEFNHSPRPAQSVIIDTGPDRGQSPVRDAGCVFPWLNDDFVDLLESWAFLQLLQANSLKL
jgi:hypothetical protein